MLEFDKVCFGERIKYFRQKRGFTQDKFSELADISSSYLNNIESGKYSPTVDVIVSLLNALQISFTELFSDLEYENLLSNSIINSISDFTDEEIKMVSFVMSNFK